MKLGTVSNHALRYSRRVKWVYGSFSLRTITSVEIVAGTLAGQKTEIIHPTRLVYNKQTQVLSW